MILSNQSFSWLDLTPNHWVLDKVKDHFYFSDIQTENFGDYPVLSLTMSGVKKRNMDTNEGQLPESYEKYNLVDSSCLVFNPMDLISGWVDVPQTEGLISPSYRTIKSRSEETNLHFIKYYFQSLYKEKVLFHFGEGVHYEYRWGLGKETLKNFPIPVPPKEEQEEIVSYLDKKTNQIDVLIEQIELKIELLKEQRKSLINEVVTKGLNPDVEMKESGIEWIGEIPSHWEITKLKYKGNVIIGLSFTPDDITDENNGTLVLRSSNVQSGKLCLEDTVYVNSNISEKLRIRENDILICSRNGSRKLIGKNCLISKDVEGSTWGVFMSIYRCESPVFFYWLLNSSVFKSQSGLFLTSTINQLTVSTLENMLVPYVSDLNEQKEIVKYLEIETQRIDETIFNEEKRIKLLKEYKQSLISEVVIGKKRVV